MRDARRKPSSQERQCPVPPPPRSSPHTRQSLHKVFLGVSLDGTIVNEGRAAAQDHGSQGDPVQPQSHLLHHGPAEPGWYHFKFTLCVLYTRIKDGTKWQRMRLGEGKPFPK